MLFIAQAIMMIRQKLRNDYHDNDNEHDGSGDDDDDDEKLVNGAHFPISVSRKLLPS